MEYWDTEVDKKASDKSFSFGIRLTHDQVEKGRSYKRIRAFLKEEKNFEDPTINRIFKAVKKTRRSRVEKGEPESQPSGTEKKPKKKPEKKKEKKKKVKEEESQKELVDSVKHVISEMGHRPSINILDKSQVPIVEQLKTMNAIKGFNVFSQKALVCFADDIPYYEGPLPEGFEVEEIATPSGDFVVGEVALAKNMMGGPKQVVIVGTRQDLWVVSDVDYNTWNVRGGDLIKLEEGEKGISVWLAKDIAEQYQEEEYPDIIPGREATSDDVRIAQTTSPWEPLPEGGGTRQPQQWMNLSWEALMDSSRKDRDYEDLRDVPIETRMWPQHVDLPDIQLENRLRESEEKVKKLEYDEDDYWGQEQAKTLEGRMVEEKLNERSETWEGNIPQIEKRRIR